MSILAGWLFLETTYERLGLLLLGCSPGGANSNFWVQFASLTSLLYFTSLHHMRCTMHRMQCGDVIITLLVRGGAGVISSDCRDAQQPHTGGQRVLALGFPHQYLLVLQMINR